MTDPIGDMLTRLRNAQAVKHKTVNIPYSKIKWEILRVLQENNWIEGINRLGRKNKKFINVILKYNEDNSPVISEIKRISKPSQRIYSGIKKMWPIKKGMGTRILSTPAGIFTDREAKKLKVGGEILLEIW